MRSCDPNRPAKTAKRKENTMGKNKIPETGIYDARQLGTGRMLLLGFQHMFAMFGATILVPILTGLDVSKLSDNLGEVVEGKN